MEKRLVYVTCGDLYEAKKIARTVVDERLAACANLLPEMQSFYWWEGKVESSLEVVLILKTAADRMEALTQRVKELHSYEVPCVISLPLSEEGNDDYHRWLEDCLRG